MAEFFIRNAILMKLDTNLMMTFGVANMWFEAIMVMIMMAVFGTAASSHMSLRMMIETTFSIIYWAVWLMISETVFPLMVLPMFERYESNSDYYNNSLFIFYRCDGRKPLAEMRQCNHVGDEWLDLLAKEW